MFSFTFFYKEATFKESQVLFLDQFCLTGYIYTPNKVTEKKEDDILKIEFLNHIRRFILSHQVS